MSTTIPQDYRDSFNPPAFVAFGTINADGSPHVTPVWVSYDGTHVLINTARGRRKANNVIARQQVSVLSLDAGNPYRYAEVRGEVVEITETGAVDHINALSMQYTGQPYFGGFTSADQEQKQTRIILKIAPHKVITHG